MQAQMILLAAVLLGIQEQAPVESDVHTPALAEDVPKWTPDTTGWLNVDFVHEKMYERIPRGYSWNDRVIRYLVREQLCEVTVENCAVSIHIYFAVRENEDGSTNRVINFAATGPQGIVAYGFAVDIVGVKSTPKHWSRHGGAWKKIRIPSSIQFRQNLRFVNYEILPMVREYFQRPQQ